MTRAMHRILVVEDDPALRRILSMLFETNGFRVVAADTCDLAIRQAQTHRPDFCIRASVRPADLTSRYARAQAAVGEIRTSAGRFPVLTAAFSTATIRQPSCRLLRECFGA
jgi:CheY-like chemotaxis protein